MDDGSKDGERRTSNGSRAPEGNVQASRGGYRDQQMLFLHLQTHHLCSGNVEAAPGTSAHVQAVMRIPSCCTVVSQRHPQTLCKTAEGPSLFGSASHGHILLCLGNLCTPLL